MNRLSFLLALREVPYRHIRSFKHSVVGTDHCWSIIHLSEELVGTELNIENHCGKLCFIVQITPQLWSPVWLCLYLPTHTQVCTRLQPWTSYCPSFVYTLTLFQQLPLVVYTFSKLWTLLSVFLIGSWFECVYLLTHTHTTIGTI